MAKKKSKNAKNQNPVIATNRRARHDYTILDTWECGVVLVGTEVKALREGKASLNDAFATIDDGEVWLRGLHIPEYSHGNWTLLQGGAGHPATGALTSAFLLFHGEVHLP